jgi:hypothetical protein
MSLKQIFLRLFAKLSSLMKEPALVVIEIENKMRDLRI